MADIVIDSISADSSIGGLAEADVGAVQTGVSLSWLQPLKAPLISATAVSRTKRFLPGDGGYEFIDGDDTVSRQAGSTDERPVLRCPDR
ncbi:hypothetical protein FHR83_006047 [Actinoplanes campanulatus]|uniref:Uncharacterized protein n=1 Tax=Actinoplanes campanulatus TaxID=113559 RepID=A0A7W5FHC4_9ACTN|nr:hypothetical protein [Actinoplanes campanulatus]MBB3098352.1 hypothetical protein [Actinoplanes campanulatus]GGN34256.1 hypothetical protein GCM10010109_57030 [Actinoplanes campanulatus]GID38689.1 hypothetical protein Aca09nite_51950 [Actinoplanes campanulatus]